MRRWLCVLLLLFGFAGDDYPYAARLAMPVPIERGVWTIDHRDLTRDPFGRDPIGRTTAWWRVR
jgi:hypothetical protein